MKISIHKITLIAILTSAAVVLAIIESFIPSIGIPGVRYGFANILILITLYELGVLEAVFVNLCRVILASLIRGTFLSMGFLMSLTGAFLSLGVMILFYLFIKKFSVIGVSVIGSLFHVFGQIIIAIIYLGSGYVIFYLPIIAISAIVTGIIVGIIARIIINSGVIRKQRERYGF